MILYRPWKERISSSLASYPPNYPVTSPEKIEAVHNVLHLASTELDNIDRSIQLLIDEKTALLSLVKDHHRLLQPIFRIPPETWIEIFELVCESNTQAIWEDRGVVRERDVFYPLWHPNNKIIRLARVCSSWRNILHACPSMWSSLYFGSAWQWHPYCLSDSQKAQYEADPSIFAANKLSRLSEILHLSKGQPLRISYNRPYDDRGLARPLVEDTLRMLAGHHQRWKRLDVYNVFDKSASQISACITQCGIHGFPTLEEMNLEGYSPSSESDLEAFNRFIDLLGCLPSLRRASFSRKCPQLSWPLWGQLERITLHEIRPSEWHSIHPFLLNAIEINITEMICYDEYSAAEEPYNLPSLEVFSVDRWIDKYLGLPNASRLRQLSIEQIRFEDLPRIVKFIQRSRCEITRFICGNLPRTCHYFIPWRYNQSSLPTDSLFSVFVLFDLPKLQTLEIKRYYDDDIGEAGRLILALSPNFNFNGVSSSFCPYLRYLHLGPTFFDTKGKKRLLGDVVDLIKMRWENHMAGSTKDGGLKTVGCIPRSLASHDEEEFRMQYERVKAMEKEGLEVEWCNEVKRDWRSY